MYYRSEGDVMGSLKFIENLIESKLLNLHTAYLAKVLAVNGSTAKIQPLGLTKQYGEAAAAQSPLSKVPIINSARYKIDMDILDDSIKLTEAVVKPLKAGDIVICVCCERDIAEAKKGKNTLPPAGHHQQSDSVIVGIL